MNCPIIWGQVMATQGLTGLELVMVAAGMLIERHHVGPGDALFQITENLRRTDRPAADVARDMIVQAGPDAGDELPEPRSGDHPRLIRPAGMPAVADGAGSEAVALAIGVLVERHGQTVADAVRSFAERRAMGTSDPVKVAWDLVDEAASSRPVHD